VLLWGTKAVRSSELLAPLLEPLPSHTARKREEKNGVKHQRQEGGGGRKEGSGHLLEPSSVGATPAATLYAPGGRGQAAAAAAAAEYFG